MTSRTLRILLLLTACRRRCRRQFRHLQRRAQPGSCLDRQRRLRRAGARSGRRNLAPARRAAGLCRRRPGLCLLDDAGGGPPRRGGPRYRRTGECLVDRGHAFGGPGRGGQPRTVSRARQACPAVRAEQPDPDGLGRDFHREPGRPDDGGRAHRHGRRERTGHPRRRQRRIARAATVCRCRRGGRAAVSGVAARPGTGVRRRRPHGHACADRVGAASTARRRDARKAQDRARRPGRGLECPADCASGR